MSGADRSGEGTSEDEHDTENIFEGKLESGAVEETPQGERESETVEQSATQETAASEGTDSVSEEEGASEGIDSASAEDAEESPATDTEDATADESAPASVGGSEKDVDEMFCSSCGEPIKKQAEICPHCGVRQGTASSTKSSEKNPGIAAVASFFFPGLGDIYNGEFGRGAVIFVGWFVGAFIWTLVIGVIGAVTLGIGLLAAPLYAVVNFVSAYLSYKRAEQINAGEIQV